MESVVESLPSFRKTALVDKLVESWSRHLPHWEPETGTIWRFIGSLVLSLGEKACAKFSFQSYSTCREYHYYFYALGFASENNNKEHILCLLGAAFQDSSSVRFLTAHSFHYEFTTLQTELYLLFVTYFSLLAACWVQCVLYVFPNCNCIMQIWKQNWNDYGNFTLITAWYYQTHGKQNESIILFAMSLFSPNHLLSELIERGGFQQNIRVNIDVIHHFCLPLSKL